MPSVLFVCTANRFRSPLASAFYKKALLAAGEVVQENRGVQNAGGWFVGSAGTWAVPGEPALPIATDASLKFGVDLSSHTTRRVSGRLLSEYDLILVMQNSHKEALQMEFPSRMDHIYLFSHVTERGTYDIPDSYDTEQEVMQIAGEMDSLIQRGYKYIFVLATALHNQRSRVR